MVSVLFILKELLGYFLKNFVVDSIYFGLNAVFLRLDLFDWTEVPPYAPKIFELCVVTQKRVSIKLPVIMSQNMCF